MDSPTTPPSQPLPVTNALAQDAVTVIEDLTKKGETAAEAALIAQAPVLANPILMRIWEPLFDLVVKLLMRPLATLGGRVVITAEEYVTLKKVAAAQAALDQAKKAGDPHAIQDASQKVDQAVAAAVHYVGGTHA